MHYPFSPHTNFTSPSTNPVYLYTCDIHSSGFDGNDGNPASIDTDCWVCLFTAHSSHNHNIIPTIAHLSYSSKPITFQQLHEKLGHLNEEHLKYLLKSDSLQSIKVKGPHVLDDFCKGCVYGKQTRRPFKKSSVRPKTGLAGENISVDMWGPANVIDISGYKYFSLVRDSSTCYTLVALLKTKDLEFDFIKRCIAYIKTQTGNHVKSIRFDGDGHHTSHKMSNFLDSLGIEIILNPPHSSQNNPEAERAIRTQLGKSPFYDSSCWFTC